MFKFAIMPRMSSGVQSGSRDGSGTKERSRSWRAARRSESEAEQSWSSARWRISLRVAAEMDGGGGMEKVEGGSGIEGCWVKIGECGSGNLHWVKLWEAEEEEDSESRSGGRREWGGGWSEAEGREGSEGE